MGKIITLSFTDILPSEFGINSSSLSSIINAFEQNVPLLPIPVREIQGKFAHIDGRHRLAAYYLSGSDEVDCYLVEHRQDRLQEEMFSNFNRIDIVGSNEVIWNRWKFIESEPLYEKIEHYAHYFKMFRETHPHLENIQTTKAYVHSLGEKKEWWFAKLPKNSSETQSPVP